MNSEENNQKTLKEAQEISENYGKIIEVRQKLFELSWKVNKKRKFTPSNFVELVNRIMELSYILTDLEMERVMEEKSKEKILKEMKAIDNK